MPTYAHSKIVLDEAQEISGEAGIQFKTKFRIDGILTDTDFLAATGCETLAFAMNLPSNHTRGGDGVTIPQRGDTKSLVTSLTVGSAGVTTGLTTIYCINKKAMHVPGNPPAPGSVYVTCEYGELGLPQPDGTGNTYMWLVGASINGSTVATKTNFGWKLTDTLGTYTHGNLIQVYYKSGGAGTDYTSYPGGATALAADVASGIVLSQYVNFPSLETISNIQWNMREIVHPSASNANMRSLMAKIAYFNGSVNNATYMGFPANTLRLRVMVGSFDVYRNIPIYNPDSGIIGTWIPTKTTLWDTSYYMEHRLRGWKEVATLKEPWTGFEFPDTENPADGIALGKTNGNGWVQALPLIPRDFSILNLPDIRQL